ncbi:MAG: hypothetical protein II673_03985, partial [Ruminococcus sp.]|nr:hypothetical protein [Ruminococcus sp.]
FSDDIHIPLFHEDLHYDSRYIIPQIKGNVKEFVKSSERNDRRRCRIDSCYIKSFAAAARIFTGSAKKYNSERSDP